MWMHWSLRQEIQKLHQNSEVIVDTSDTMTSVNLQQNYKSALKL